MDSICHEEALTPLAVVIDTDAMVDAEENLSNDEDDIEDEVDDEEYYNTHDGDENVFADENQNLSKSDVPLPNDDVFVIYKSLLEQDLKAIKKRRIDDDAFVDIVNYDACDITERPSLPDMPQLVIDIIFAYFSIEDRARMECVSKSWRSLVRCNWHQIRQLSTTRFYPWSNFSRSYDKIRKSDDDVAAAFLNVLRRMRDPSTGLTALRHLEIDIRIAGSSEPSSVADDALAAIPRLCPQLEKLVVRTSFALPRPEQHSLADCRHYAWFAERFESAFGIEMAEDDSTNTAVTVTSTIDADSRPLSQLVDVTIMNAIGDDEVIAAITKHLVSRVRHLSISGSASVQGDFHSSIYRSCDQLTSLDLSFTGINEQGLRKLLKNPPFALKSLTALNLSHCESISAKGLRILSQLIAKGKLKRLQLRGVLDKAYQPELDPRFYVYGLASLLADGRNNLRYLDVSDNEKYVHNESLLAALHKLPRLKRLEIRGNRGVDMSLVTSWFGDAATAGQGPDDVGFWRRSRSKPLTICCSGSGMMVNRRLSLSKAPNAWTFIE